MVCRIELRVYAGAPSSRVDDDRYRAQAEAYSGFQGRRIDLQADSGDGPADPRTRVWTRDEVAVDDNTSILPYEATTYVEDTQLAYNALESQLMTSSLTEQEVTPRKRQSSDLPVDTSPWPEDLGRGSPVPTSSPDVHEAQVVPHATTEDRKISLDRDYSPTSDLAGPQESRSQSSVLHGLGRKRRVGPRPVLAPAFKPFKIPMKRPHQAAPAADPATVQQVLPRETSSSESSEKPSESSYLKTPVLDRTTKKPRLEQAPDHVIVSQERPPVPYAPLHEGSQQGLAYIGDPIDPTTPARQVVQRQSQVSGSGDETTSELPTTYSLSDITSQSSRARLRASQRSISDPGPATADSQQHEHNSSQRTMSQPPSLADTKSKLAVAQKTPEIDAGALDTSRNQASHELVPRRDASRAQVSIESPRRGVVHKAAAFNVAPIKSSIQDVDLAALETLRKLPYVIQAPQPTVSLQKFTTHVTDALRFLAESSSVADHFNPVSVARDLRPLERGYWLLNASLWSTELQVDFMQFVERMITQGDAGWGVWCVRENDASLPERPTLGTVKIFCWGEIIKHIYLMLYVASGSKVRRAGLQWIDAQEKVVVQMRGAGS